MLMEEAGDVLGGSGSVKPRVKKLVITDEGAENEAVGIPGSVSSTPAGAANRSVRFLDASPTVKTPVADVTASVAQRLNSAATASVSPAISASVSCNSRSPSPRKSPKPAPIYETEPAFEELMLLSDTQLTQGNDGSGWNTSPSMGWTTTMTMRKEVEGVAGGSVGTVPLQGEFDIEEDDEYEEEGDECRVCRE
ncbi:hypothetical protein BC830DRAFT_257767 [Chytriomyces sp. MP71]|nr:hypothetical protein BC830DRAFT_257767 [Chytriomyces sp. MP71]